MSNWTGSSVWRASARCRSERDWVVRYDNRFFQLQPQSRYYAPPQGKVLVCEGREGSIVIEYRGHALRWQQIPPPARPSAQQAMPPGDSGVSQAPPAPQIAKRKWVPPANHPWRQAARAQLLSGPGLRSALRAPQVTCPRS